MRSLCLVLTTSISKFRVKCADRINVQTVLVIWNLHLAQFWLLNSHCFGVFVQITCQTLSGPAPSLDFLSMSLTLQFGSLQLILLFFPNKLLLLLILLSQDSFLIKRAFRWGLGRKQNQFNAWNTFTVNAISPLGIWEKSLVHKYFVEYSFKYVITFYLEGALSKIYPITRTENLRSRLTPAHLQFFLLCWSMSNVFF